ncbi:hypothetical protein ACW9HQ_25145 [Nocardia gipuzkoensis]
MTIDWALENLDATTGPASSGQWPSACETEPGPCEVDGTATSNGGAVENSLVGAFDESPRKGKPSSAEVGRYPPPAA